MRKMINQLLFIVIILLSITFIHIFLYKTHVQPIKTVSLIKNVQRIKNVKVIFIVSARRSGTHMTMDMLFNAFRDTNITIVKTNHVYPDNESLNCECLEWMHRIGYLIHPTRNIEDNVASSYYYQKLFNDVVKPMSFDEYIDSPSYTSWINRWIKNELAWSSQERVITVTFDEVFRVFPPLVNRLRAYLNIKTTWDFRVLDREKWSRPSNPVGFKLGKAEITDRISKKIRQDVKYSDLWNEKVLKCKSLDYIKPTGISSKLQIPAFCPADMRRSKILTNFD